MKIAIMCFKRGRVIARNGVQDHPRMTLEQFKNGYRGQLATREQIQRDKVELPGPDYQLWKTDRFYIAFKEDQQ